MRIVFLGNNWLSWKIIEYLIDSNESIVSIVLHPPNERKYGQEIRSCVKIDDNLIFEASQLSDSSVLETIANLKPDLALSVLFGKILQPNFIRIFSLGVINVHPSYLPFNRGAYPNVWSIVDSTPAGATIHFIDEGVDTGDIIAQTQISVEPFDTGESLYKKLEDTSLSLFKRTWPKIKSSKFERVKQTESCCLALHCLVQQKHKDSLPTVAHPSFQQAFYKLPVPAQCLHISCSSPAQPA